MINAEELGLIESDYFNKIGTSGFSITIQSKNTHHYWHIVEESFSHFRHFKVYHKHKPEDEYHRHPDKGSLKEVITEIQSHDRFQMNGRKMRGENAIR